MDIALRTASEQGASRVKSIRLKIGEWTSIDPDCIQFYFDAISVGTSAEKAGITVDRVPLTAKCTECGSPFTPD
ncbi:MAG: hydrogenase maturation nickel metallochaperone HypA, partial [Lentisphaerae bacterium]|nr:hydrogenase maturation nickel metallochaperone HypA [Lentisphaerota bacterium]